MIGGIGAAITVILLALFPTHPESADPVQAQTVDKKPTNTAQVAARGRLAKPAKTAQAYRAPAQAGPAPLTVLFPAQTENTIVVAGNPQLVKQDAYRNPLPENAEQWNCVTDKTTGLVWEVKTKDKGLQDARNYYSWYQSSNVLNHGDAGLKSAGRCRGGIDCDTESYINAINKKSVCGYSDWRLPTRNELLSLVQSRLNTEHSTMIDTRFFPSAAGDWFWTSDTDVDDAAHAWYVLFYNGRTMKAPKHQAKRVRLVRSDAKTNSFKNVAEKKPGENTEFFSNDQFNQSIPGFSEELISLK